MTTTVMSIAHQTRSNISCEQNVFADKHVRDMLDTMYAHRNDQLSNVVSLENAYRIVGMLRRGTVDSVAEAISLL